MAAAGTAPIHISLDQVSADAGTDELLAAILRAHSRVTDIIFSPGRTLQVQIHGALINLQTPGVSALTADDTRRTRPTCLATTRRRLPCFDSRAIATCLTRCPERPVSW